MSQKASRCLHRILRGGIAAGQDGAAQMSDAVKAILDAANEDFAAPDRAIVAVARAVETHADDALVPFAALGKNGSDVRAVMLDASSFGCDDAFARVLSRRIADGDRATTSRSLQSTSYMDTRSSMVS